jgi:hypothetical protein
MALLFSPSNPARTATSLALGLGTAAALFANPAGSLDTSSFAPEVALEARTHTLALAGLPTDFHADASLLKTDFGAPLEGILSIPGPSLGSLAVASGSNITFVDPEYDLTAAYVAEPSSVEPNVIPFSPPLPDLSGFAFTSAAA